MNHAEQGKASPLTRPEPWRTPRRDGTDVIRRARAADRGPLNRRTARSLPPAAVERATIVVAAPRGARTVLPARARAGNGERGTGNLLRDRLELLARAIVHPLEPDGEAKLVLVVPEAHDLAPRPERLHLRRAELDVQLEPVHGQGPLLRAEVAEEHAGVRDFLDVHAALVVDGVRPDD